MLNRAVQLRAYGGPEVLRIVDLPLPTAGAGEVRVRVLASSVNYTETLIRRHLYPQTAAYKLPFVMGYDVVGEIDQLGSDVTGFNVGDRVADMTVVGSDAMFRILEAKNLTLVPPEVDAAEAATLIPELDYGLSAPASVRAGGARAAHPRTRRRRSRRPGAALAGKDRRSSKLGVPHTRNMRH